MVYIYLFFDMIFFEFLSNEGEGKEVGEKRREEMRRVLTKRRVQRRKKRGDEEKEERLNANNPLHYLEKDRTRIRCDLPLFSLRCTYSNYSDDCRSEVG
jgi:hypothetical protein